MSFWFGFIYFPIHAEIRLGTQGRNGRRTCCLLDQHRHVDIHRYIHHRRPRDRANGCWVRAGGHKDTRVGVSYPYHFRYVLGLQPRNRILNHSKCIAFDTLRRFHFMIQACRFFDHFHLPVSCFIVLLVAFTCALLVVVRAWTDVMVVGDAPARHECHLGSCSLRTARITSQ